MVLAGSCSFYKKYDRPDLPFVDSLYRRMEVLPDSISTAAVSWDKFFTDTILQGWIRDGLKYNTDLNIARLKVKEAEAALLSAKWALLPGASFTAQGGLPGSFSASVSASWETDIFGANRNGKRRAQAALEQSKAYEQAVQTQLVATIAESYYTLLGLDEQLTISRVKSFYFKPMTREEAVMQMNLLNHDFFAFRDEDNGGTFAVVYRRKEGGYGLIDDTE